MKRPTTYAMKEWGVIGKDSLVALGKPAKICKFIYRCGYEREDRLVLSNPHST